MTPEDRLVLTCWWSGVAAFVSVLYLDGGWAKAIIIGLFIVISCLLGFGRRWLFRVTLALSILAIAVALGFPAPAQWLALAKKTPAALSSARGAINQATSSDRN